MGLRSLATPTSTLKALGFYLASKAKMPQTWEVIIIRGSAQFKLERITLRPITIL